MITELVQFKTKQGVSDADILIASEEAHEGFVAKCRGFISRELLKSAQGQWVDIARWETMMDAQKAMQAFMGHPATRTFGEIIVPSSIKIMHLELVKKY